jgi:poly(3-hydroxybutyrate) depolymerase
MTVPGAGTGGTVAAGGTAGTSPAAGSGGTLPAGGTAGAGGATAGAGGAAAGAGGEAAGAGGATAGAGGTTPGRSAGCGLAPPIDVVEREYTRRDITVTVDAEFQPEYTDREYHIMLPYTYDPNRAYPMYMWGTGCGASHGNAEGIPMSSVDAAQSEVIFVFLMQEEGCFQAGSNGTANTPDVPYINKVMDEMEANFCVDTNREFLAGWSSGAWLAGTMSCALGNRLRGIAMSTGGQQPELMPCQGPIAALFFVGSGDGNNPIGGATGSGQVYNRLKTANGCQEATTAWNAEWPDCVVHDCGANPVVYCEHGGGHTPDNGTNITREGHYEFFMNLTGPAAD